MRFTFLTALAFVGLSMATKTIPSGGQCKKDGSMGSCESKLCIQPAKANIGKCK
ncbi:hypothetical protein N7475_001582 [Penicillium sp. IBT 31633x]|nr:hypothetical protein N7475_001582 [Penicillium sp. IBT 31633x]